MAATRSPKSEDPAEKAGRQALESDLGEQYANGDIDLSELNAKAAEVGAAATVGPDTPTDKSGKLADVKTS